MAHLSLVVFSCLVIATHATTTHHPHHTHKPHTGSTHEPNEVEQFAFFYNYQTQNLIVRVHNEPNTDVKCYIVMLDDDGKGQVHTDDGLRQLELRAQGMLTSAVSVTKDSLNAIDVKTCGLGHHNISYFTIDGSSQ